ncbi:MFS-type transporter M2 [Fulvia fulva]|uniref:MFS-type transporter M2 n=1 Tax=Passalora fulva TaxID=5499 RepID=A0A9Q8L4X2_PASFU|nr:MFS-type transporter M2 [Fulvia fulva]KAK4635610.1 MFS-type transporter M2 [Fulvia fulva]KAK4636734.1 MFS-type transporter M2 [Fulvia fulva]UJO10878.1 MFS-type transporter M2 [Fulvia fulva]WPV08669.1 MFS-type transporter M2 [Fulvia fulva]WPV24028.1 MFS-type transporter M2 [Fulvia fulva]
MSRDGAKGRPNARLKTSELVPTERTTLLPSTPPAAASEVANADDNDARTAPRFVAKAGSLSSSGSINSMAEDDEHTKANQSIGFGRAVCSTIALGTLVFLIATNMSMLTTIQSAIASELDAFDSTPWFTSSFLICTSALGPLNGKLSAVFTPRLCIVASSIIIAIGEVITAFATSLESFLVGRSVAGVGASGVFTISIIIVLELTGSKRKGLAIGLLNSGYTFGVAVGATGAGFFLPIIGWRALFWIQAPIALLAGLMLFFALPFDFTSGKKDTSDHSTWKRVRRIDYLGAITLTTSLVLMLYALSSPKSIPILPLILSVVVATAFVLVEAYLAYDPIIPVALLRHRGLLFTCLGTVGYMMSRWCVLFYAPTYAIAVRQWPPSVGGAMLIPTNAGFATGGLLAGWLHIRRKGSFWTPTVVSYAIFPVTLLVLGMLSHRNGSPVGFIIVLFINGCSAGAALNYSLAHVLHLTPKEGHYIATALNATFRGFAGSFGSAVGGGLFTRTLAASLASQFAERGMKRDDLVRRLLGSPALVDQLHGIEREVAVKGYEDGLQTLWYGAALLAFAMVFVQAGTGWKGHEEKCKEAIIAEKESRALLEEREHRDREDPEEAV